MACLGNTGESAEFNIQMDPEAAKIVMKSRVKKTMIPLQVTHAAIITAKIEEKLIGSRIYRTPYRACMQGFLKFFRESYADVFGFKDGPPLHDPVAVAYVLSPEIFVQREYYIDIETSSELTYGQTICDMHGIKKKDPNCGVAVAVDIDKFWEMMIGAVNAGEVTSPHGQAMSNS